MTNSAARTMAGKPRHPPQEHPDGQPCTGASRFDLRRRYSTTLELLPMQVEELHRAFWEQFWETMS